MDLHVGENTIKMNNRLNKKYILIFHKIFNNNNIRYVKYYVNSNL